MYVIQFQFIWTGKITDNLPVSEHITWLTIGDWWMSGDYAYGHHLDYQRDAPDGLEPSPATLPY